VLVGKQGISATLGHLERVKDAAERRGRGKVNVRVPYLGQRVFLAQVGDAYYGRVTLDTGNDRVDLQGAETFTVCDQLFRGGIVATENKDVVFEESRVYLSEGLVVHA